MSETTTQPKIGSWSSFLFGKDKEGVAENADNKNDTPKNHEGADTGEVSAEKKEADYKALYEEMQGKYDKQAKAIEISKRTSKENQKLKSQLQESKSRVSELGEKVENAHDVDEMADLKAQIIKEQSHQQALHQKEQSMRDMQETNEIIETKLTGFHSLDLSSAIKQQADLMGLSPEEGAVERLAKEPQQLGRDHVISLYLIATKDKQIADMKKELENLKIKHSDPQMEAIKKQSDNFTYNEDYNSNKGFNPSEVDKFLATASVSELEKHLYKRS